MEKPKMTKRILCVLLSLIFVASAFTGLQITAEGATNPYNYYAKDDSGNWANCTWWAWQLAYDNTGVALPAWGNAGTWYNSARNAGYSCGTTPAVNSIAVKSSGTYGHVQFVTAVSGSQIYVKEGGYRGTSNGYHEGWTSTSGVIGYIYLAGSTFNIPEGVYVFHCVRNLDRVLDIRYDSKERGAKIQLLDNWYNQVQKFRVVNMGNYYCIQSVYSGMWLDIANKNGSYSVDGCDIQLWDTNTSTEQKWVFEDAGNGNVYIRSLYGKYLDTGGPTDNYTGIQTYHFDGTTSQQWKLELTSPYGRKDVADGIYTFHNYRNQNRVIDIQGNSKENRANIQLYDDLNDSVQQFRVTKKLDNTNNYYYLIQSVYSGLWLDIASPFTTSGCNIQLWHDNNSPEEKWVFEDAGNGKVLIRSLYGTYVDLENGKTDNWTNIQTFNYDGSTSMEWVMHKVYTITYNANGGSGAPAKQSKQSNISIALSSTKPSKAGYIFNSWNTKANGTGTNYASGASFSGNSDTTFYAIWSPCSHSWIKSGEGIRPTCTNTGSQRYICSKCNGTKTEIIAATGHTSDSGSVTTQPTCTQTGVKTYKCTTCGATVKTETVSALGHTKPDSNGNCTRCGEHIKDIVNPNACPYCGQVHDGFFGRIVAFFHKVIYFISHLF
ncbi:MAG: RICIN domain-containing protein [Clostridia bacterium]|nr:RICIN domain-containing protein [Clostridia bacterium]